MRVLAIGDFHGKFPRKLQNRIRKENFDLIVGLGDYADTSTLREIEFKYWEELRKGKDFEDIIGKKRYNNLTKKAVTSQEKVLKILASLNKPIVSIYGNSDELNKDVKKFSLDGLEIQCKKRSIKLLKTNFVKFDNQIIAGFSGYRGAKPKGFIKSNKKDKKKVLKLNKKWENRLKRIFSRLKEYGDIIFIAHDVPYSCFDKVKLKSSPLYGKHIGDKYFFNYIRKFQPLIFICGHMHEYQGIRKIGKTLIVATGTAQDGKAAIIDFPANKKGKIKVKFIR